MKKKGFPAHVQIPTFTHPQANAPFIAILESVPDPRGASPNFSYSLTTILFIVTVTVLCGAEDWEDMALAGQQLEPWISQYVDTSCGIPSAFTLERVISLIDPSALESMLGEVSQLFCNLPEDIIALDGKTLCGSKNTAVDQKAVHILNAWSCRNKVCLGQIKVDDKSNEITAIGPLLDRLFIKEAIITADAINTQKAIVEKIVNKEAHYVLPVKGNHKGLLESIQLLFAEAKKVSFKGIDADEFEAIEKSRGRIEERLCVVLDATELVEAKEWAHLRTVAKITRRRTVGGKTTEEEIYYISDLGLDAEKIARAAREHWGVENGLHHSLDVVLSEDNHIYRDRNGAANLSAIRKIVLAASDKLVTYTKPDPGTAERFFLIFEKYTRTEKYPNGAIKRIEAGTNSLLFKY
jgi:predicted transposase YbfD/YdcC